MIEYGMGVHGEKGVRRVPMESADKLCDTMMQAIFDDGEYKEGDEVCVYINAFGSTSVTEMAIAYRRVRQILGEKGIRVHDSDINNYFRTQEMGGFSISLLTLDDELKQYYDMPCYCPYYAKGAVSAPAEDDTAVPGSPAAASASDLPAGDDSFDVPRSKEGPLEELDAEDVRGMILAAADKNIRNMDYLTEIDNMTGDGDHGLGMAQGRAMLLSMGGASGVIFGSMFLAGDSFAPRVS